MTKLPELAATVLSLVKMLVDYPEAVSMDTDVSSVPNVLRIRVAQTDLGHVIGQAGRTARSLRVLLTAISASMSTRVALDITGNGSV